MCDLIEIFLLQIKNDKLSSPSINLGCPPSDMSLERSNMKLRIVGVFKLPNKKRRLVYGRFSKKKEIQIDSRTS